uniref:Glyco_hydro_38C domain-containing protein n=1 Tax=Angiostrongylus cantonensis TaxID=6313 RepID=A0A0K0DPY0_ANGCA
MVQDPPMKYLLCISQSSHGCVLRNTFVRGSRIPIRLFLLCVQLPVHMQETCHEVSRMHDVHPKLTKIVTILTTKRFRKKLYLNTFPRTFKIQIIDAKDFHLQNRHLKTFHSTKNGMLTLHHSGQAIRFIARGILQQTAHLYYPNVYKRIILKNVESSIAQQINFLIRLDITKEQNTEFVMRLTTDLESPRFYADSAGLQLLRRERYEALSIPENYYPMPSASVLEDNSKRITLATNVEHGISHLPQGMEILLDRMLNQDDNKGLGSDSDSLPTDLLPIELGFSVIVEAIDQIPTESHSTYHTPAGHLAVQNLLYPPIVAISGDVIPPLPFESVLPCNYQLLTVRPVANGKRLMTIFNNGITCSINTMTTCSDHLQSGLTGYLRSLNVVKVQETNLVGLKPITEEMLVENYNNASIEPYKFLSLLLTYSS